MCSKADLCRLLLTGFVWLVASAGWAGSPKADWWVGRVLAVTDGDTLRVEDAAGRRVSVRLEGVDAPELRQCGGPAARDALAAWVGTRHVLIEPRKTDRYGRTVARVHRSAGEVGLQLVAAGHAWHYQAYAREQTQAARAAYANAERQARARRAGLWACDAPEPPWTFRRR